jgi:hypothetical protein
LTANSVLIHLTSLGFRLEAGDKTLRLTPASKLTGVLRKAIKDNKAELLALLRAGARAQETRGLPPKIERCQTCGFDPPGHPYCPVCQKVHKAGPENLHPGLEMGPTGAVFRVGSGNVIPHTRIWFP